MKKLLEVLTSGTAYLAKRGVDEARLNMEHLLGHVLACRRMELYLRFDHEVKEPELEVLRGLLKRRGEGEPLQHLLGTVEFSGYEFVSDHRALIPRPETETLVELLIHRFGQTPPATIVDLCTGSGCIGLSLAKAWPSAQVLLTDVSEDALELATLNAKRLNLPSVRLLRSDLFEKIQGRFDLIVANPPYIPSGEIATLSREVRRDPDLALDGGPSGLELPLRLIQESLPHLSAHTVLALELGWDQGQTVAEHLRQLGFQEVSIHKDLAQVPRFIIASGCPVVPEPVAATEPSPNPTEPSSSD